MKTKTYAIAGFNIKISSQFDDVHALCRDYLTDVDADFSVCVSPSDIEFERMKSLCSNRSRCAELHRLSDGYFEGLAVYRKIAEQMPAYNRILFHGSAVAVDSEAYLFTAKSGTGKSTHTRLWREYFGSRAVMVNDDKPLIGISESGASVYGTPWNGKHRLGNNIALPLRAICILERAENNTIQKISVSDAYPMLLQQAYRPMEHSAMKKTLEIIDALSESVGLFRLKCNMDIDAVKTSYFGMRETI